MSAALLSSRHRADLALLLVSLLWGITFPLIRSALQALDPFQFVLLRFALASIVFLPLVLARPGPRSRLRHALLPGLGLGVLAWFSYFTQTVGLQTVGAGRAAFVTGLNVILVPLLSPLMRAGRPGSLDVGAAVVAALGLYLLTGPRGGGFSVGDGWVLLCALSYALYIHLLQKVLRRGHGELALAFTQIVGVTLCGGLAFVAEGSPAPHFAPKAIVALLVCALLATVGTFWLQTRYQGRTTPERVALIFSMEPVFATFFAYWILGETLSWIGTSGALLILASVLGSELLGPRLRPHPAAVPSSGSSSPTT